MSEQTEFRAGKFILNTKLEKKELVSAFYILAKAEIGDNLRAVTNKLPAWIRYKNDIKKVFNKLVILEIIRMEDARKGAQITEISESATIIASDAMDDIEVWQDLLNGECQWFPKY